MGGPDLLAARAALTEWWSWAGVDAEPEPPIVASPVQQAPRAGAPAPVITRARAPAEAPTETTREIAARCRTLAELDAAIRAFDGCGLKRTAKSTVVADGVAESDVLLIGEAPGKEEDESGKPFVGRSGQLLDRMLATIGLSRRENLLIANVIFWRPPGNRPPTPQETAMCLPFVERLITLQKPKLLLLAGGSAAKAVLRRDEPVSRMRGRKLVFTPTDTQEKINTLVMLHPAYLLRRPQEKRLAWADLLRAEAWADELGIARGAKP